MVPPCGL
jgi:hypothetical protein